ncbi:MAG: DUF3828 domain-containing protein [Patescibacteria group bacterium]
MDKIIKSEIAIGIILIIAAIVGGFIWLGNKQETQSSEAPAIKNSETPNAKNQATPAEKTEKTPEQIVKEYYESLISYLNRKTSKDNSLSTSFVTQKIIQSYNKLVKDPANKMSANPFLCAQDFPDDASKLSITLISKDSASAKFKVIVYTGWPSITVSLINDNGAWKINDILCFNGNKL